MAINQGGLESLLRAKMGGKGFVFDGEHSRTGDLCYAISVGVVNELHASALVIVPPHAGGTYKVTGLSESGMSGKIVAALQSRSIKLTGEHAKADVIPKVIASAVTSEVLGKCQVAIPYDGSGEFQIIGLDTDALELSIKNGLTASGFNLKFGDSAKMAEAVAAAVAIEINSKASVSGSFAGGGSFPVL